MKTKKPLSASERGKAYRARCKAAGIAPTRGRSKSHGKNQSKFERGNFVAIDGEGENYGDEERFENQDGTKTYFSKNHRYTLLAASTGSELFLGGKRLGTKDCFDFLLELSDDNPYSIFVIFSGGYDFNHILMADIALEDLKHIAKGETWDVILDGIEYRVEYRQRKSLTLKSGKIWTYNSDGKTVLKFERKIIVWDVFGFFQDNFVNVIKKWLGESHPDFALIEKMKALRGKFDEVSAKDIRQYNDAELRVLVELMGKVRDAIHGLGLVCKRWDGAGAVAAAIFDKEGIKDFKRITSPDMELAVRTAYAGGRIEACKVGVSRETIHHYDINSAYPSVMKDLPCLRCGHWHHEKWPNDYTPNGFTLVHIRWEFIEGLPFYPFFFRNDDMSIMYPAKGEGWYWYPEFAAGVNANLGGNIEILEYFQYVTKCNHKPFVWISQYYDTRQKWVENPEEEWQSGGEKVIKLGLNSLYGKTAQQLGGTKNNAPTYFQMEWAGYITSATRAALFRAAMQAPWHIVSFATDGLFSLKQLALETPAKKVLGQWEYKKHDGMVMVMPGVYWIIDGDKFIHYSRGFDKDTMKTPTAILDAWKQGKNVIAVKTRRLIGIGTACASDIFWKMRGRFIEADRNLQLDLWHSEKREIINIKKSKPYIKMVDTVVRQNILDEISAPYPIKWLEGDEKSVYEDEKEIDKEIIDTYNI